MTSPRPNTGKELPTRQLPGLQELLSPGISDERSQPPRFPPLNGLSPPMVGGPLSSPLGYPPQHQGWRPGPPTTLPTNLAHHHESSKGNSVGMVHGGPMSVHQGAALAYQPTQQYMPPMQRLSLPTASDYRVPPPVHQPMGHDDLRRDSTRSNATIATSSTECVGQQHFPGRGLCYVYSDGASCPTVIDGEMVNPLWGTTKAGKARKRLAQACLNCREKKIRCEPRHPRCLQCEKSKRECIMPSTQPPHPEPAMTPSSVAQLPMLSPAPARSMLSDTDGPQAARVSGSAKRRRSNEAALITAGQTYTTSRAKISGSASDRDAGSDVSRSEDTAMKGSTEGSEKDFSLSGSRDPGAWDSDPYLVSQEGTMRLLHAFFSQSITVNHQLYPQTTLWNWVTSKTPKSSDERMVLYTMLAAGAAISNDQSKFGSLCAERATAALNAKFGHFSVLLAQARIFMTIYRHAKGQDKYASEYYSGAVHALKIEKLFSEEGCQSTENRVEEGVLGMTAEQMIECKRRTFWAGFVLDRFSSVYGRGVCNLPNEIIHLRYPCSQSDYERSIPSRAPLFDASTIHPSVLSATDAMVTSPQAFIISVARATGYAGKFVFSSPHTPSSTYARDYEICIRNLDEQLARWYSSLRSDLHVSGFNLGRAVDNRNMGLITSMASLYHMTIIQSVRFVKHGLLDRSLVAKNVQRANHSSHQLLQLAGLLCSFGQNLPEGYALHNLMSPFFASAVFLAIDTISAAGLTANLRELLASIMDGYSIIATIGYVWPFARENLRQVEKRVNDLQNLLYSNERPPPNIKVLDNAGWRCTAPLEKLFEFDYDVIYGADAREYLHALRG